MPAVTVFTTNLFRLLDHADVTRVSGYEIETVQDFGTDANGVPVYRCECDEDNEWFFTDQAVVVRNGLCTALTANVAGEDEPTEVTLEFLAYRAIEPQDIPPVRAGGAAMDTGTSPVDVERDILADAKRLDYLEKQALDPRGIYLHANAGKDGVRGLNVVLQGSLRAALDLRMDIDDQIKVGF